MWSLWVTLGLQAQFTCATLCLYNKKDLAVSENRSFHIQTQIFNKERTKEKEKEGREGQRERDGERGGKGGILCTPGQHSHCSLQAEWAHFHLLQTRQADSSH